MKTEAQRVEIFRKSFQVDLELDLYCQTPPMMTVMWWKAAEKVYSRNAGCVCVFFFKLCLTWFLQATMMCSGSGITLLS